jgi:hypothetical protein
VIETQVEHPFYTTNRGWQNDGDLRVGDQLVGHDGRTTGIDRVTRTERAVTVYSFRVEEDHTYYVGGGDWGFSVWVYNVHFAKPDPDGNGFLAIKKGENGAPDEVIGRFETFAEAQDYAKKARKAELD